MGWRMTATRSPASRSTLTTARLVWLFPAPVRVAQTATTGRAERSMVRRAPRSWKSAPAALALLARCMTSRCETSE